MVFNRLNESYSIIAEINAGIRGNESSGDKYLELGAFIKENQAALLQDLLTHREHISLYKKIEQLNFNVSSDSIKSIRGICALLQLKTLLANSNGEKLAAWVLKNREGIFVERGVELFEDLSRIRQIVQLTPKASAALSTCITFTLGLKEQNEIQAVRTKLSSLSYQQQLKALAHWINSEKIPLAKLQLSNAELSTIAPFLHYVNCRDLKLNDLLQFIQSCSSAHHLLINDPTIESLNQLPLDLQILNCSDCDGLQNLDLTNNAQLEYLSCNWCCYLNAPNLSHNQELRVLSCFGCNSFIALDLSKNLKLDHFSCIQCTHLNSLGDSLPDSLRFLACQGCRSLVVMPQLSLKYIAQSQGGMSANHYFKVSPKDLEEKPRQVLLDLGKIVLNDNPMPNIIYIDHATGGFLQDFDRRSVQRHFVATLCQNLFKEGSHFTSIEFENTYIPTLRSLENLDAVRTFARLIGVAATTSSPIPVPFHHTFFHGVFQLKNQNLERLRIEDYLPTEELDPNNIGLITRAFGIEAATLVVAKELKDLLEPDRFSEFGDNVEAFIAKVNNGF